MSKLDELIKKYCPNGVSNFTLAEICDISAGGDVPKKCMSKYETDEFNIPIISNGIGKNAFYGYTNIAKITCTAVTVAARGTIGYAEFRDYPFYPIIRLLTLIPKNEKMLNTKYLYFCLQGKKYSVPISGIPQLTAPELKKTSIPVPPLPVQEELVRILDSFTSLTSELTAELEARNKQYEYYRTILLNFSNVQYYTLESVCNVVDYRGKTPKKVDNGIFLVTAKNIRKGYIDYDKSQEYIAIENYDEVMKRGKPELGDVLITTEAPCGNIAQIDRTDIALAQRVIKYRTKDSTFLDNTYLKYVLLGTEFQNKLKTNATGGTVKGIKGSKLHQLTIPIPPIEMQKKIVKILDCFYRLCKSITSEIETRQKQYEYYRDKLLTFKELS